jgi:hypothetical protein
MRPRRRRYVEMENTSILGLKQQQKLQPFFPPLEPLQSLNLRAALYRCLNELKKNGVLGRESVLRKTMLDECKGDKLYEILAIFSNVVLKKVLAAQDGDDRDAAVARKMSTASMLSADQQRSLLPLAIAHKAALVNLLKRKENQRRKYVEFERLLDKKSEDINRRIRKCKDTPRAKRPAVSQKEADTVKKQLKDNWIGNQKWLDVMLHGDDVQAEDAFLHSRFDKVWHMVEKGQKLEEVAPETGLLENLQSRVQEQQERLQKWKAFHEELRRDVSEKMKSRGHKGPAPAKDFKFEDHSQFQLPSSKHKTEATMIKRPALRSQYEEVLYEMNAGLFRASKARVNPISTIIPRRSAASAKTTLPPIRPRNSTRSESISEVRTKPVVPPKPTVPPKPILLKVQPPSRHNSLEQVPILPRPSRHVPTAATPPDSEITPIDRTSTLRSAAPVSDPVDSPAEAHYEARPAPEPTPPTSDPIEDALSPTPSKHTTPIPEQQSPSPEPTPTQTFPSEPPAFDPPNLNPEEALADQIINSLDAATPSPVKKPQPRMSMSLIERTRMSMARTTSFEPLPESPDLPMAPPPVPSIPEEEDGDDRRATLLERTKMSMLAMGISKEERERKEKKERRSTSGRQSLFPVNQFDTPRNRKSFELPEQSKLERTPTEVLFSDEVDYDRVFKSRPRIATSPVFSPGVDGEDGEDPDGVTGIDLGDVDQDDDEEGFTRSWQDSPSQKRGGMY